MKEIYLLTDYGFRFGTKWKASPYRSGYDKQLIIELFAIHGFKANFIRPEEVEITSQNWTDKVVLYTSSEEKGLRHKEFLLDLVWGLQCAGATVIPGLELLRAHENKVFMETLRKTLKNEAVFPVQSRVFGSLDELQRVVETLKFPIVLKSSSGSMSRGVFLCTSKNELLKNANKLSSSAGLKHKIREFLRTKKHKGYLPESANTNKFIVQDFLPGLKNDWKVLIYGSSIFVLTRNIKPGDFRASGSGFNYASGSKAEFPTEFLPIIYQFYKELNTPHLSLDVSNFNGKPVIFEFQGLFFGTSTQYKSDDFYQLDNGEWTLQKNTFSQEEIYVKSIVEYISEA